MDTVAAYALVLLLFDWRSAIFFLLISPLLSLDMVPYYFVGVLAITVLHSLLSWRL